MCVDLLFGGGDVLSLLGDGLLFLFPFPLCLGVEVRGRRDLCAVFGVDVSWSRDLIFSKLMGAKVNKNYTIIFVQSLEIMQNNAYKGKPKPSKNKTLRNINMRKST